MTDRLALRALPVPDELPGSAWFMDGTPEGALALADVLRPWTVESTVFMPEATHRPIGYSHIRLYAGGELVLATKIPSTQGHVPRRNGTSPVFWYPHSLTTFSGAHVVWLLDGPAHPVLLSLSTQAWEHMTASVDPTHLLSRGTSR